LANVGWAPEAALCKGSQDKPLRISGFILSLFTPAKLPFPEADQRALGKLQSLDSDMKN